ncbi:MAG: FIG00800187: hypothetical protein, partial [uncultured Rubellimicrobium sp.]
DLVDRPPDPDPRTGRAVLCPIRRPAPRALPARAESHPGACHALPPPPRRGGAADPGGPRLALRGPGALSHARRRSLPHGSRGCFPAGSTRDGHPPRRAGPAVGPRAHAAGSPALAPPCHRPEQGRARPGPRHPGAPPGRLRPMGGPGRGAPALALQGRPVGASGPPPLHGRL